MDENNEFVEISYKQEIFRKLIHLCSLGIPLIYIFIERYTALSILIPLVIMALMIDFFSRKGKFLHNFTYKYLGAMLRKHERNAKGWTLNGASWVLIAALLIIFIFPKIIAVVSFTILIISDLLAALIGRKFGKNKLLDKSLEGTLAFIVSAVLIVITYYMIFDLSNNFLIFGIIASIVGGIVEVFSKAWQIDDNLTIPFGVGLVLWFGAVLTNDLGINYLYAL